LDFGEDFGVRDAERLLRVHDNQRLVHDQVTILRGPDVEALPVKRIVGPTQIRVTDRDHQPEPVITDGYFVSINPLALGIEATCIGEFEIPDDPQIAKDFRLVRRQISKRGPSIHLSSTADGRHCDYAPAILRACSRWIKQDQDAPPEYGTKEHEEAILEEWRLKAYAKIRKDLRQKNNPFKVDPVADSIDSSLDELFSTRGGMLE
jgi:hypothetical protein